MLFRSGGAAVGGFPVGRVEEGEAEFALRGLFEDDFLAVDGEEGEGEESGEDEAARHGASIASHRHGLR